MKKLLCVIMSAVMLICASSLNAFALTPTESQAAVNSAFDAMFSTVAGDVNGDGTFSALDARSALLASAGLASEAVNTSVADLDGDGIITAIDARSLLRVSAQLDSESVLYSAQAKLNLFNALANDIKYSTQRFRNASVVTNIDMSYDNQKLVDKFNSQMNGIPGNDETIDLGAELEKDKGKVVYRCGNGLKAAAKANFPLIENEVVSLLTLADVSTIEYKTNQSVDYVPKNSAGTEQTAYIMNMTGLDSITVYFNEENVTVLPDDSTLLRHGKVFDVPKKDELTSGYNQINNMFKGMEDLIGTMSASFKNIKYHDSYVTIYFDHATKKVCLVDYNLYYDFTVNLAMDLQFLALGINLDDNMNITDKEHMRYMYCFANNYVAPAA